MVESQTLVLKGLGQSRDGNSLSNRPSRIQRAGVAPGPPVPPEPLANTHRGTGGAGLSLTHYPGKGALT